MFVGLVGIPFWVVPVGLILCTECVLPRTIDLWWGNARRMGLILVTRCGWQIDIVHLTTTESMSIIICLGKLVCDQYPADRTTWKLSWPGNKQLIMRGVKERQIKLDISQTIQFCSPIIVLPTPFCFMKPPLACFLFPYHNATNILTLKWLYSFLILLLSLL